MFDVTIRDAFPASLLGSVTEQTTKKNGREPGKRTDRFSPPESNSMSSYGQHVTSSFQQDSALVAQFSSYDHADPRNPRSINPSDITEETSAWNDTIPHEPRPRRLTIGRPMYKSEPNSSANELSPLLLKPIVTRINKADDGAGHPFDYRTVFFNEVKTLAFYALPVFGCAHLFSFLEMSSPTPILSRS